MTLAGYFQTMAAQLAPRHDFVVLTVRTVDYNSQIARASSYTTIDDFNSAPLTGERLSTARLRSPAR